MHTPTEGATISSYKEPALSMGDFVGRWNNFIPMPAMPNTSPILVVFAIDGYKTRLFDLLEKTGSDINDTQLLANVLFRVQDEARAYHQIQNYCADMIHQERFGTHYEEQQCVMEFLMDLSSYLVGYFKSLGLYEDGRLNYVYDGRKGANLLLRRKDSFYARLRDELKASY